MAMAGMYLMSSCTSGENKYSAYGYYTITGNMQTGYVLYQDGGGKLVPTEASVNSLTNGKGFDKIERGIFGFSYVEADLSDDKNTITGAELFSGESISVLSAITTDAAEEKNVLHPDSSFIVTNVSGAWAYRGYLTIIYTASYAWNEKHNGYLYPSMDFVYDADKQEYNELNLSFYHNEHRSKSETPAAQMNFATSLRLEPFQSLVPGSDSVKVNITFSGITKPVSLKVARKDFVKGDWR